MDKYLTVCKNINKNKMYHAEIRSIMTDKSEKKPLIILTGPTASGKTELSVKLAKAVNGEIISADSIQVYKYMDIGSAKVTAEEMEGVRHYLVDELNPRDEFNIYIFKEMAKKYTEEIYAKGKVPVIAGGTGFYIQSLLYDIDFINEDNDKSYRIKLMEAAREKGNEYVHNMLKAVDPKAAENIHFNNLKRVIRALEYNKLTGKLISEHNDMQRENISPYDFHYFVLNMDRGALYDRINRRADIMMEKGLVREVKGLLDMGFERELTSMQGIGYREIISYLYGECTLEQAVESIKQNTRHFAKRQLTWFRREKSVNWITYEDFGWDKERMLEYIVRLCS